MWITHLELWNWRNFHEVEFDVQRRLFVVGPNAAGKSNLLDSIRFLRDLAADGGGLQAALEARGGLGRVRNLNARNFRSGAVGIRVSIGDDTDTEQWVYQLEISREQAGKHRPIVRTEKVWNSGKKVLSRPTADDDADSERLTQTALEQVTANSEFRTVASFFQGTRYLHLVPQLIRDSSRRAAVNDDPFGGDFLSRIAKTPQRTRDARLRRMNDALRVAVPQLDQLALAQDDDGKPHLTATYKHWRPNGARQDERDFSDGTLRLIGLLWSLQEGGSTAGAALLEEPELSLHAAVVAQLPALLARAVRSSGRQVLVSTHAYEVLQDPGLGLNEVLMLEPGEEGTNAKLLSDVPDIRQEVEDLGLSVADSVASRTAPAEAGRIGQIEIAS